MGLFGSRGLAPNSKGPLTLTLSPRSTGGRGDQFRSGGFEHDLVFGEGRDGAGGAEDAAAHDGDAVAGAEQLGEVAADHEDGATGGGEFVDELVDLGLGADVDAAGGL